ncbi:transglutaminaseTgpA domain-containing protein [Humibacter ginsenosidimutans]|uniref:Transglutaminase domain-containing protein n=1 Tax=Humibacter ginsenosidimutans TaxID=2599293 RepID=A0A5B8M018_9MICO|nr:transglutaminase domain-containing protein [Humibacter ginsenosidimutans]QDZ14128.1 transglutaminase domain-containing protein [Humibacter ginsenosidimutans]
MTATAATPQASVRTTRAETAGVQRIGAAAWVDLAVFAALMGVALMGFAPAFGRLGYVVAAVGGLVIGSAAAALGVLVRLPVIVTVLAGIVAFFVFGTAVALPGEGAFSVLPTLSSLADLAKGVVFGWSDSVTLRAPLQAPPYLAVVPYAATLAVSLACVSVALRVSPVGRRAVLRAGVIAAGPALVLLASILMGTRDAYLAGLRGVAFAVIALCWLGWRIRRSKRSMIVDRGLTRKAIAGSAVVALVAVVGGTALGMATAPSAASRFVVRDAVQPPFDPLDYPAPLASFRKYTGDLRTTKLFSATNLPKGSLVRLVTMDSYDGIVWSVAGPDQQTNGSGSFELLGSSIPSPSLFTPGATSASTFTVLGYDNVWLPNLGYVNTLNFDSHPGTTDPRDTVRVNAATGTTAVTSGVSRGLTYTVDATAQKVPSDKVLKNVPVAKITMPSVTNVPDVVATKANQYAGGSSSAIQKLRNIERSLKKLGYLSHGRASDPVPSRAGEGADRMNDLLQKTPMVGDQEQYATAFALMARHFGYPVRVVMGFKSHAAGKGTTTFTGNDITAWDEVAFQGVGWVPFFPTPTKTDAPKDQTVRPKLLPQPQVRQPPDTPPKADDLLTPVKTKDSKPPAGKHAFVLPTWAYYAIGVVLVLALAVFLPMLIVAWRKRRRRRRRATGPEDRRAAGAWDELVDGFAELGYSIPSVATRSQTASTLQRQSREQGIELDDGVLPGMAVQTDAAVFDGSTVSQERSDRLWTGMEHTLQAVSASAGWLRRRLASYRFARRGGQPASGR